MPDLLVITDVCLCEYMSHGHCGIVHSGKRRRRILNDPTLKLLARTAASHAEAGADIIRSERHDGWARACDPRGTGPRGFTETPIMSTRQISLGVLRSVSRSCGVRAEVRRSPHLSDGRGNANEALREVALGHSEGADIVMVKPALAYLDILHRVKTTFGYPRRRIRSARNIP
jgi:porphobilinogen synthase